MAPVSSGTDPSVVVPYLFALMQRNIATAGFVIADHNQSSNPPAPGGFSAPGCVLASPSWEVAGYNYPGNVAQIGEDYAFNWTRDAAITMSTLLSTASTLLPATATAQLFSNYVAFASTCQASGGVLGQAKYTPEAWPTGAVDESDGPALRVLTVLQGFPTLAPAQQNQAADVIAADLGYLLDGNRYQAPTATHWEDTYGQSLFARSVQLRCFNEVVAQGPALGLTVPAGAPTAAQWLAQEIPAHWSTQDSYYISVLGAERLSGDPQAPYDPSIDPVLACVYGAGIEPTDAKLLSTAGQARAQWTAGGSAVYPINAADNLIGLGPVLGRYLGDEYDGLSLTSETGHPWAVCTCAFAQLYYELASAIAGGTPVPSDQLAAEFLEQVGVTSSTSSVQAVGALRAAGDNMLNAAIYHSNNYELSEQFDQQTGYEKSVSNLTWSYAAYISAVAARSSIP
jgi:glucoamylase